MPAKLGFKCSRVLYTGSTIESRCMFSNRCSNINHAVGREVRATAARLVHESAQILEERSDEVATHRPNEEARTCRALVFVVAMAAIFPLLEAKLSSWTGRRDGRKCAGFRMTAPLETMRRGRG